VNLTAPTLSNAKPTSVNLEAPPSPEIARKGNLGLTPDFGAVPLEGPSIPEKILGNEQLNGPETIDKYLNPVLLTGAPINDSNPGEVIFETGYIKSENPELGKTELEGERLLKQPLGKVIMSTPSKDLEITNYTEIGKADQKAPQQNDVINEKSTDLSGPDINVESSGSLGNSSQETPPTNTDK
jgi:hypothetical protein